METMSKPENQIDYIELSATKVEETKQFYSAVFGWKFEDYGPDYTSFSDGRLAGGFSTEMPGPGSGTLLVIYAGDLAAIQEKIKEAGGGDSQRHFLISRRSPLSFHRPERERTRSLVRSLARQL
jgi:uncharacterized protein